MYPNQAGHLQFPFHSGHDIHRIGSTDSDGNHAQTACIRSMRIRTHHHTSRESVIFQYHLMDDTRSRLPESQSVMGSHAFQKIIYLLICLAGYGQIGLRSLESLNQVVTMYRNRYCRGFLPAFINCSRAICAVASCMATRSGRKST